MPGKDLFSRMLGRPDKPENAQAGIAYTLPPSGQIFHPNSRAQTITSEDIPAWDSPNAIIRQPDEILI